MHVLSKAITDITFRMVDHIRTIIFMLIWQPIIAIAIYILLLISEMFLEGSHGESGELCLFLTAKPAATWSASVANYYVSITMLVSLVHTTFWAVKVCMKVIATSVEIARHSPGLWVAIMQRCVVVCGHMSGRVIVSCVSRTPFPLAMVMGYCNQGLSDTVMIFL